MRSLAAAASLLAIPLLGAGVLAQQASQTSPILVDVVATDSAGQPVQGLQPADFEVREDGRPVAIQALTQVDSADAAREGRTYLIAVDSLHLSLRGAMRVRPLLEQFVTDFVGPHDRIAVATLGQSPRISALMTDRHAQLQAIGAASADTSREAARQRQSGPTVDLAAIRDASDREFAALTAAARHAVHQRGRRVAVLFISEGISINLRDSRDVTDTRRAFFAAAAHDNISVYPIDPVGMSAINPGLEPSAESEPAGLAGWDSLRLIARSTGGRAILGHVDMAGPFRQIVQDNSAYYVLAYDSPHAAEHDGDFHEVRVHVNGRGVTIRARTGWYEPASER